MKVFSRYGFERLKRRWVLSCITTLISLPIMCLCFWLMTGVFFPFLDQAATASPADSSKLLIPIGALAVGLLLALPIGLGGLMILKQKNALDPVFTPLGISGKTYLLFGRQYHGLYRGRELNIYFYRGPTLEISLSANLPTRLLLAARSTSAERIFSPFTATHLSLDLPELADFYLFALDEPWARNLLSEEESPHCLHTLMTFGAPWAVWRRVEMKPGQVTLSIHRSMRWFNSPLSAQEVQTWVDCLEHLAAEGERLPAPQNPVLPETDPRQGRDTLNQVLLYSVLAILIGMPLCFALIFVAALFFTTLK